MNHEPTYNGLEVAVIGMSGRFPGAKNIHEFWTNLKNGVESIPMYNDEELKETGIESSLLKNPNFVRTNGGAITEPDYFDAMFFGYTPLEAEVMSPQVRVFHECCWEALEDAGYDPWSYHGAIGLYAGGQNSFEWQMLSLLSGKHVQLGEVLSSTLYDKDNMASRISYNLDLKGPSFSLHTACSTALVAVHLACQALLSGECDMALAGASIISRFQGGGYLYQQGDIMSSDGHIRTFDARAKGLVYSDGAGVVLLKPLENVTGDRDFIYAIIKGSAINNDGHRKVSYAAPSVNGQETVIRAARYMAEIEPETIGYVETHGTGTSVGDPIEIQALKQAFDSDEKHFCAIGSVKTNVGHMVEAAAIGGMIKTVLSLKYGLIPPSLHFETSNPGIDLENSPFYVNTRAEKWEKNSLYPRRAGVSSFARGGTNAHIVLEEAPKGEESTVSREWQMILLSAKTGPALQKAVENLYEYFNKNREINIADAAYTLQVGRKVFEYRGKFLCTDVPNAIELLSSPDSRNLQTFVSNEEDRPVVFMFPGLGPQYVNMGLDLYRDEPVFREEMDRCFEILKSLLGYDVREILYPGNNPIPAPHDINGIEIAQAAVFIIEYALSRLVMKWGISPRAMIGYSFGEYTAACLSGVFSLEDALTLIVSRGQLIRQIPGGEMLSVPLPVKELKPFMNEQLSVAIDNGPSCIVSGPSVQVQALWRLLKEKRYICMLLDNSHAIHSQMMEPILNAFAEKVNQVTLNEPQIPYISNVSGTWITAAQAVDPGYWADHLRETVQFADGINELRKDEKAIFVEIGPGRDLSTLVLRYIEDRSVQPVISLMRHPGKEVPDFYYLLTKISDLWLYGKKIDWAGFYSEESRNRLPLPTYPFQRQRYFIIIPDDWQKQLGKNPGMPAVPPSVDKTTVGNTGIEGSSRLNFTPDSRLMNPYEAPRQEVEKTLANIWEELLGVKEIGISDDFLDLGGDSLKAVTVVSRIQKEYNVVLPLETFFKTPTIKNLAQYINNAEISPYTSINTSEKKEYYVLSSAQKRLYILQEMEIGSVSYNLPQVYVLEKGLSREKMENSFKVLIERHEVLRTSFEIINGEPVQKVNARENREFEIDYYEVPHMQDEAGTKSIEREMIDDFIRPFHLSRAPLMRVGMVKLNEIRYLLMIDMHHIVSDGVSNAVLIQDFIWLYAGEKPQPLLYQYKDYAEWQNHPGTQGLVRHQEAYWLEILKGELPRLNLPVDFPRPAVQSFEGNKVYFEISREETDKLKELARQEDTTLYMVMLVIFNILLAKLSGMEDIIIGIDVAGRNHADLEQIIGVFINTLVLRSDLDRDKTVKNFLAEIKAKTLGAFENQDYQFEHLVEKVVKKKDSSRNPIFDVMFTYENFEIKPMQIPGSLAQLSLKSYGDERRMSKLDLNIKINTGLTIGVTMEYCTKLFKEETIRRFTGYFKEITTAVIENREIKLGNIKISHNLVAVKPAILPAALEF